MIWAFIIVSVFYWVAVAADVVTTRAAVARGAGTESNLRFVDSSGRVRYGRNLVMSVVTWGAGAAVALIAPYPFGVIGTVWIAGRGAFRLKAAIHNHRLGRQNANP